MDLLCVGVNHRTAPIAVRECLSLPEPALSSFGQQLLHAGSPLLEAVVISTCNRFEVYAVAADGGEAFLREAVCGLGGPQRHDIAANLRASYDEEAVRHLCAVAAGLDSMVLGEPQVLGQVAGAHEVALRCGTSGTVLNGLFRQAVECGKRVQADTAINERALSVAHVAVELATGQGASGTERRALLIGAGEMAEAAARHLRASGVREIAIVNRSPVRAQRLAERVSGTAHAWADLGRTLAGADLAICCVGAVRPVLDVGAVADAMAQRRERPLVIVDIGVPRNVAPEVGRLANVRLYDIDALRVVVDRNLAHREREMPKARAIVEDCTNDFASWYSALSVVPTIRDLHAAAARIRDSEVDRALRRLDGLDDAAERVVRDLGRRIVGKLLHQPTVRLKLAAAAGNGPAYADVLRDLFDLDAGSGREPGP